MQFVVVGCTIKKLIELQIYALYPYKREKIEFSKSSPNNFFIGVFGYGEHDFEEIAEF